MKYTLLLTVIFIPTFLISQVRVNNQNQLFINYDGGAIGSSDFVISRDDGTFVGMYINSNNSITGRPFYGYSINGGIKAFSFYDGLSDELKLNVGGSDRFSLSGDSLYLTPPLRVNNNAFIRSNLQVGSDDSPLFIVSQLNKQLYFNTSTSINQFTDFTLRSTSTSFGGMAVDVDSENGKPFYAYATEGIDKAFSYFDGGDSMWKLYVDDGISSFGHIMEASHELLEINGDVVVNGEASFNEFTDFTINASTNGYGGMYIVSDDSSGGKPFYGYAINGIEKAFTYYDESDNSWKLFVTNEIGTSSVEIEAKVGAVKVQGELQLTEKVLIGTPPPGTIYYDNNAFWGVTATNTIRRLDNVNSLGSHGGSSDFFQDQIDELKRQNSDLKEIIFSLESQVKMLLETNTTSQN